MWHCFNTSLQKPSLNGVEAIIQLTYSSFQRPSNLSTNESLKINPSKIIRYICSLCYVSYIIFYMTKLIIQIPSFNEGENILQTLECIPKNIKGVDEVEVLVINDGSTDDTAEIAEKWGAFVINVKPNKGLANAFRVGLNESLKLGADIIVNTDADNQYKASDIETIIKPIIANEADIVVGARDILSIKEFSFVKKVLQKLGTFVLRLLSSTNVEDAPSGFRAFSKAAALKLNVFDNYTYTMETLIQAGAKGLKVVSVPIGVNPPTRKSKLVKNIFDYVFKSMKTTIRMFIVYRPFRFFAFISGMCAIMGALIVLRFLYYYSQGFGNGHIQSLIFGAVFLISSVQLLIVAVLGDLLSINRKLIEDVQIRVKKIELDK